jgi:SAM-dependent methyltransferase
VAACTLLDIFHATPQSSPRLIPIAFNNQCVASVAALRETKMSSSVLFLAYFNIRRKLVHTFTALKSALKKILQDHHYPRLVLHYPGIIDCAHRWNDWALQRNRLANSQLDQLLKNLPAGSTVLDAGFGDGQHLFRAAKRFPSLRFIGIDKHEKHVEFGKLYARQYHLENVSFKADDLAVFELIKMAEVAVCIGVLQYIQNDEAALKNLYRSMKPGGILLLYVPVNGKTVLPFFESLSRRLPHYEKSQQRKRVFQPSDIEAKLVRVGFQLSSKRFTYGPIGILGHEIYSLLLMALGNSPVWIAWFFAGPTVLYLPLLVLLNALDAALPKRSGNGLMLLAKKS